MADTAAIHPPADRLAAYALGRLDGPEIAEIEQHLSSCDSCCSAIEDYPGDSLVLKLGARRDSAALAPGEVAGVPAMDFQVPSSFVVGAAGAPFLQRQPTVAGAAPGPAGFAGLPQELIDHPRYRVVAAIGAGGMGAVYRAEHRLMDRPVALKVIRGDLLGSTEMVERFRGEVRAAARLASHPNVVAAYDAEQAGETHMLVMEFVEGSDLAELVTRRGPLPVGEACEYARQAALGLQHAFLEGMVHRDIKPQNLMLTTRGQVKILDFGLSRFASEAPSQRGTTAQGMVLGSADYIAPEQIDDPHAADIRADLYSLGCTLYFLLAGRPPFPDGSLIQKLMAHREKLPRPLADVRAGMPRELVLLVDRMMAKSPPQRFQTPDEVALALAPFADAQAARAAATARADALTLPETAPSLVPKVGGAEGPWQRVTTPGKGRRRTWLHLAVALALLALGGGSLGLIFTLNRGDKTVRVQALPPDRSTDEEPPIAEVGELPGHDVLKQANKTIVTERPEALNPAPTPMSDLLTGPEPEEVGTLARFPSPHDLPEQARTIVVLAPPKKRGGPSLAYAWDGKSEHPSLLFSRKSRVVQELHSFAIGRDGRQYYLSWNEPSVVEADQDGERRVFTPHDICAGSCA